MRSAAFRRSGDPLALRILQLQRTAGNRAVSNLLQPPPSATVQRILATAPLSGGTDDINRLDNKPVGTPTIHQGVTTAPAGPVAPAYTIETARGPRAHTARVVQTTEPNEGTNEATYLGAGTHNCGYYWTSSHLYDGSDDRNRLIPPARAASEGAVEPVVLNVSSGVAAGSRRAEAEHLNDHRLAYDLSLGAADRALKSLATSTFHGKGREGARQNAQSAIVRRWPRDAATGMPPTTPQASWAGAYDRLVKKSSTKRDSLNFHLQTVVDRPSWNKGLRRGLSELWRGETVHHVDVTPSTTFKLGVPSATVITWL